MEELKKLKEQMQALREGNFDVEAPNPRVVKCWERLECDQKECPAYGRLRCWSIAGTFCRGRVQGVFARKLGDCRECIVYQESCGDEIGELLETFNQMIKDLKHGVGERERSSQEKARSERVAELGDMIAAVAHETRNPLHAIGLAAAYLKKNFHGEPGTEFLTVIEEEVKRLSNLTSLFLTFSHPAPLRLESCDLNATVAAAVEPCRREAAVKSISLAMELDSRIPEMSSDHNRIREIIAHLLENALSACGENESISISTRLEGDYARISVQDNGPGIAPEEQEKVFRPFYTTKSRGPGLGLAIASRSAAELNGRIELESAPGRGCTFSILLPLSTG